MKSTRFPDKPMALINGIPMIQRVWEQSKLADIGPVVVACCEKEVFNLIKSIGGDAYMTSPTLESGTDRIFQAFKNLNDNNQFDSIINLQGDMPLIDSQDIKKVNLPLTNGFDIGTLVTNLTRIEEKSINITKAKVNWTKDKKIGNAVDFYKQSKLNIEKNIYHHVGIYSFSFNSLKKFTELQPSKNEIYHKLEQWRALDANMKIGASFVKNVPLSVDTKEDLIKVENIIKGIK